MPAELPEEFMIQSALLDSATRPEDWRTDEPSTGVAKVFPNLDIILANAKDTPKDFVQCFVDQGWATSEESIGPLAQNVRDHMSRPATQALLESNPDSQKVLVFDALLSLAQYGEGSKGDTLWMGCPALPQQLLRAIQLRVAMQPGSTWSMPMVDQTVKILGDVTQITDQARGLARSLVVNHSADWGEVQKLVLQGEEIQDAVQLLTPLTWAEACQAARSQDLPTTVERLQKRERRIAQSQQGIPDRLGEGLQMSPTAAGPAAPTLLLAREPADGDPKLTPAERDELEEACKNNITTRIELRQVRLLTEATGTSIVALQPGGPDISRVKLSYDAENLIMKTQQELATNNGLRKIPLVTLAKVFSLRMTQGDNFVHEHLGLLVVEDFSSEVGLTKMRGSAQGAQVIKAKRHRWAAVESLEDLANIVEGLALCAKRFHHPSILSHLELFDLWATLKALYVDYGGHALIPGLFQVFRTRLEEHALAVRARAPSEDQPLPPLQQLQGRSEALFNNVREAAYQQCLRDYNALRSGTGETAWGAQRSAQGVINADGKHSTHTKARKTPSLPPTRANPHGGSSSTEQRPNTAGGSKRAQERGDQQTAGHNANKRPKKAGTSPNPCARCGKAGHEWRGCADDWCAIPQHWPAFLKSLAERACTDNAIAIIHNNEAGGGRAAPGRRND